MRKRTKGGSTAEVAEVAETEPVSAADENAASPAQERVSPVALATLDPTIRERLARLVEGGSLLGVARSINVPRATLGSYLAGSARPPTVLFVQIMAAAYLGEADAP